MKDTRIAFIGAGNMAASLVGGLIADGWNSDAISVADPQAEQTQRLRARYPVHTSTDNKKVVDGSDVVVLAVKPQAMKAVAIELSDSVQYRKPLILSIAAGIKIEDLQRWLGGKCPLVRCMPNTPALVQSGATALIANSAVSDIQKSLAENILRAVGLTLWIDDENLMDAVTAISGSGPAYFFLIIEALQTAGEHLGLPAETARLLSIQTAFGAAKMTLESTDDAAVLGKHVASPGGTTEAALRVLEDGQIRALFEAAVTAARDRSRQLSEQFGDE
ncbi:MAG: pyrroline-5-carboxylate reductase [Thiogranum sp.]|nr:pyrroline-5-carboxylate reductase [Thiogranum sp.]